MDLPALERAARCHELVAGDEQHDPRASHTARLREPARREAREPERADAHARGQQLVSGGHVGALPPEMVLDVDRAIEAHRAGELVRELDGHDGVGALRQDGARRDRRRRARGERSGVVTGRDPRRDGQLATGLCGSHGVAVHRRVVERRQVVRGASRSGEHPPVQLGERHELVGERHEPLQEQLTGGLERQGRGWDRHLPML